MSKPFDRAAFMRTAIASLLVIATGFAVTHTTTEGFEAYTLESARRLKALRAAEAIPDLSIDLVDAGRTWPSRMAAGILLVDFIYTRCETYCAALGSVYAQLQRRFAAEIASGDIQLLSVSFDPTHDDPDALRAYRTRHTPDAHGWDLGRPAVSELPNWLDAFGVVVIADGLGGYAHNAAIHVVDAERRLIAIHDLTDIEAIARSVGASLARGRAHVASR